MGYKKVCLDCRKAFNRTINTGKVHISICPQCEKPTQKETPPLSLEKEVIKNKPLLYSRIF